jgi:hypothetical protein
MTNRYEPLRAFLSSISEPVVVMTYDEIENLLGRKLPNTAYGDSWRQWWANTETHSQALAWLRAGWRVTRPDRANKHVEFRRQTAKPAPTNGASSAPLSSLVPASEAAPPEGIVVAREHLTASALRMVEDAAEESGANFGLAVAELLNRAAMARRRQLLDWFADNAPRSGTSSVQLIREDRDAQ